MAVQGAPYPNALRTCIKLAGYSFRGVYRETSIPESTLHDWAAGHRVIPHKERQILAELLGCDVRCLAPNSSSSSFPSTTEEALLTQEHSSHERSPHFSETVIQDTIEASVSEPEVQNGAGGLAAQDSDRIAVQQETMAGIQQQQCPHEFVIYVPVAPYSDLESNETIASSESELPLADIMQSHRQSLQSTLSQACTIFTLSPNRIVRPEDYKQLVEINIPPSHVTSDTLDHLSVITREYWQMVDNAPLDFLSDMLHHFQTIMRLLKETHSTPLYRSLCSLAGEHALVIGRTLYDMREFNLSLSYCIFSVKIALEIGDGDLRATGLGRMALVLLYGRQLEQAHLYLYETQQIHLQRPWIGAWLCAIEAELHAHAGNWHAFTKAMDMSKSILTRCPVGNDVYASITRFNRSMQLGFEGACLLRLKRSGAAVPVLQQSLSALHPSSLRRRSTLHTDIGMAYVLQGDVKEACSHFHQALDIIAQTKALIAFQRMYSAQRQLDQWKHDPRVESLAQHITNTVKIIRRTNSGQ